MKRRREVSGDRGSRILEGHARVRAGRERREGHHLPHAGTARWGGSQLLLTDCTALVASGLPRGSRILSPAGRPAASSASLASSVRPMASAIMEWPAAIAASSKAAKSAGAPGARQEDLRHRGHRDLPQAAIIVHEVPFLFFILGRTKG